MRDKSIIMVMPYFGRWPEWIDLFMISCRWNPTIDWVFITDGAVPACAPANARFIHMSYREYGELLSKRLALRFPEAPPYKLCDFKPTFGLVHQDLIDGYDYFGFGDLDVIYGNIRKFYTPEVLRHNVISTHARRLSGHFCLLRNTELMRNAFRRAANWRQYLEMPEHRGFDEHKFRRVFLRHNKHPLFLRRISGWFDEYQRATYFKEQYSTILAPVPWLDGSRDHPQTWYWRKGRLTNSRDGDREFLYLHFMNWKSSRYLRKYTGKTASWESLARLVHFEVDPAVDGWQITPRGFHRI